MSQTPTIGILYPGFAAEDDFPALEKAVDHAVALPVVHTSIGEDVHTVEALYETGSAERLAAGAEELRTLRPGVAMWACTSGSFVYGWKGAHQQAAAIADLLQVPASSTSIAFVEALRALRPTRVAVAASYPEDLASHFVTFVQEADVEIVSFAASGIYTAAEVGLLDKDGVIDLVRRMDHPDAEVVLVPDTAMHSLLWLADLEEAVGKPVLTANQVTVWEGLRLAGASLPNTSRLGTLFSV